MLGHDGTGLGSGWYVDSVTVDIESHGKHLVFPCHKWLATDEDDGKIERELFPIEERAFEKSMLFPILSLVLFVMMYLQSISDSSLCDHFRLFHHNVLECILQHILP